MVTRVLTVFQLVLRIEKSPLVAVRSVGSLGIEDPDRLQHASD